jgi:signal transduction histidine kinase/ligand-binding sensor domain-containing protein
MSQSESEPETFRLISLLSLCNVLCLVLLGIAASALDSDRQLSQYAHTAWRIQDGALPGTPEAFAQTTDGYLWVGTYDGLVRYDGAKFTDWIAANGKHLRDSRIQALLGARDGSLWIGTANGLTRWKDGNLQDYAEPPGRIYGIVEDKEGGIWFVRSDPPDDNGALCRMIGDHSRCYGASEGIPLSAGTKLAEDASGNFWIGGIDGVCRWRAGKGATYFKRKSGQLGGLMGIYALATEGNGTAWVSIERSNRSFQLEQFTDGAWNSASLPGIRGDTGIAALFFDHDGGQWVGTMRRGMYRIRGGVADSFSAADGLSGDAVSAFFQDREGTVWVATSKGIDRFRKVPVISYSIREGLHGDSVSTVLASRTGTVWIGNSGALDFIRGGQVSGIQTGRGLPGRDVTTMFEDHANRLWLGIDTGLWVYEDGKFRPITRADGGELGTVFGITEDIGQNIWVRAGPKLYRVQDFKVVQEATSPEISTSYVLAADPTGGLWLGRVNGDLVHYQDGVTKIDSANSNDESKHIRRLLVESDGTVWASTWEGLVRWKDGTRRTLTSRDGLPCDEIYTMIHDEAGNFWLYSKCGLVEILRAELEQWSQHPGHIAVSKILDVFDGVQAGPAPLQPQSSRSADGRLWFANKSILQMLDTKHMVRNAIPPPVYVERIVADGREYLPEENLRLSALTRDLEIDYTALSFAAPENVRFRYKLDGRDADWQAPQTRRQAFYSDLRPGPYHFHVIACNNEGVWNEQGATLSFRVLPAFYQTSWFFLLGIVALACLAWGIYEWRIRLVAARLDSQFEARLAERTRIAQDLHDTLLQGFLSASMQLHVADSNLSEDSPAKPLVGRVLNLMSQVIDEGRNAVRGLRLSGLDSDNLDQAFSRIPKELGLQKAIDFRVMVEGQPCSLHPIIRDEVYRIGREALANAFRHSQANAIEIELEYADNHLRLLVRDNGSGIDEQVLRSGREGHWGLSGMRERAVRIGAKFKVWSRVPGGTEVELYVPGHVAFRSRLRTRGPRWFSRLRPRREPGDRENGGQLEGAQKNDAKNKSD